MTPTLFLTLLLASSAIAQQASTITEEYHPPLPIQVCDSTGCQTEDTSYVMGPSRRWFYSVADNGQTPCLTGDGYDPVLCPDGATCAQNCALGGVSKEDLDVKFGTSSDGNALTMRYHTDTTTSADGYLLAASEDKYRMFRLKNREFTFDVDMSKLPCGMNGALFFVEMEEDGGTASYPNNQAGAKYGVGGCDAQCKHDNPYFAGQVNIDGTSEYGVCCFEMDIWEANKWAAAYTTHGCTIEGYYLCQGEECGDDDRLTSVCDKSGCGYNSYKMNQHYFYGANESYTVNTESVFTVVTQFITSDGTDTGDLVDIRRVYVQGGVVFENSYVDYSGMESYNSITDAYCKDSVFGGVDYSQNVGGLKAMGESLDRGVVLDFALWADYGSHMLWLDGLFPPDADPNNPGAVNGPCSGDSGDPNDIIANYPDAAITFSNIKVGTLDSTYNG